VAASTSFVLALARAGRFHVDRRRSTDVDWHQSGNQHRTRTLETVKHHLKPTAAALYLVR
jgi:hypothetical protein